MVPISKEYMEQLTIQTLVHTVKTQNSSFENEFHIIVDDVMKSCSEAEQQDWLQGIQSAGKSKKSLIELLFRRGEYLVNLKRAKELQMKEELEQSKVALKTEANKSTPENRPISSRQVVHDDVQRNEDNERVNNGSGLRETRIPKFKVDDIPKLYGNERDKVDEWIYLVETEARYQGINQDNLLDGITKLLRGNALQMLRNLQKNGELISWAKFKTCLTATLKPADVQRHLRSELKSIKISSNFEDDVMKFQTIANKIEKMPEFELVWLFLEALNPRVRAELESKNVETLDEAIRLARVYIKGLGNFALPTVINYARPRTEQRYPKKGNSPRYINAHRNGNKGNHQPEPRDKNLVCFRCKKPGHKIAQCRVKLFNGKFNSKTTKRANLVGEVNDGDSDGGKTEYVYACNSGNLLCVSGYVNGHPIKFALDSGCTTSIISSKFVKKNGLNLNDSRIKIKTANNSISKVDGKTDSLKVDIEGHVCDLEFLVIDHEDNDGLLGLDWFMRTNLMDEIFS